MHVSVTLPSGSIPASAGEALIAGLAVVSRGVDPRERGGSCMNARASSASGGRSPRARGKRALKLPAQTPHGSIPASAGEAHRDAVHRLAAQVDPRERGGSSRFCPLIEREPGRSPRARGKRCQSSGRRSRLGSIPASAGEAERSWRCPNALTVDPRERGGSSRFCPLIEREPGRSPRARGKRYGMRCC